MKSTWLWDTDRIVNQKEEIVSFAKRQGVKIIFLQVGKEVKDEEYRHFIATAHQSGVEVQALNGRPGWALNEHRDEANEFMSWVQNYNASSKPEERFVGVQFDVEPYLLKQWKKSQDVVVQEWMGNIRAWMDQAKASDLKVGVAVPFWLNDVMNPNGGGTQPLSDWMISKVDYLAIMAYRDQADQIYQVSEHMLNEADKQNKQIWVGVELAKSEEGPGVSFHTSTNQHLNQQLDQLVELSDKHPSFVGVAMHSYEAWESKMSDATTAVKTTR
ncbi:hypothetical protein J2Z69_000401 [Paenibacillus shirakamiensis]|uniref:Uncharacterized protein n=1 Tax=Paenibacillus shirakamiensis TaxID=1265935 RepID=A0ABS4JCE0_9BACL|nr:hypothetical protein [Paenibacillus shirakamiensis]MBP1999382.1 hypothetical protein [Paenibacillus shirakamiensis]